MQGIKSTASAVVFTGITLLALTACEVSPPHDTSGAKALIESCHGSVYSYTAIDATGSAPDDGLDAARLRAVRSELSRVAACGGVAKVVVFGSSSADVQTLFEDGIQLHGATETARARRLGKAVDDAAAQVTSKFDDARATLSGSGSDPAAQPRLFAEWRAQLGNTGAFRFLELTDGMQTAGLPLKEILADPSAAADTFTVPDLTGAEVTFAGIGEVKGEAPPTALVDGLKDFYGQLCVRSKADSCAVVAEVAGGAS